MSPVRLRIRELREEKGLSQAELARRVGMTPSHLLEIEKNRTSSIDFDVLDRLWRALGAAHPGDLFVVERQSSTNRSATKRSG